MRLVLDARDVPLGTTVTKPTGSKKYTISDRVRIYHTEDNVQEVIAEDGCRFLVGHSGVNAISGTTQVAIEGTAEELQDFLLDWIEGTV